MSNTEDNNKSIEEENKKKIEEIQKCIVNFTQGTFYGEINIIFYKGKIVGVDNIIRKRDKTLYKP